MYQPAHFQESRPDALQQLIHDYPLGTLITMGSDGLNANHLPFELLPAAGQHGVLRAHVARANSVWRDFDPNIETLCVFQGAKAYVTPSWYASKAEHGKVVPTYNYMVVHAYGKLVIRDDRDWLLAFLSELTARHEQNLPKPWKVGDAPEDYIDSMLKAIVGIELEITRIVGKWKVSQNRAPQDRLGVLAGLRANADQDSHDMADALAGLLALNQTKASS